jgi:hypothetical protein
MKNNFLNDDEDIKWNVNPFRAPIPSIKLKAKYCLICKEYNVKLFRHHIYGFIDDNKMNSVNNMVALCFHCHKYKAHQGSWTWSISSRNRESTTPMREVTDILVKNRMDIVREWAKKLWLMNPYNDGITLPDKKDLVQYAFEGMTKKDFR